MVFFRRFVAGGVSAARVVSSGPRFEPGSVLPAPSRPRRRPAGSAEASSIASFAFRFGLCAYHGASARARPPSLWDSSSVLAASASRFAASSSARSSSANRLTCADEARDCVSEPRFRARSVSIASLARAPASSRAFASARSSSSATRWRCFHPYGFQLLCGRMFSPPWPPIGRDSKSEFAPGGLPTFLGSREFFRDRRLSRKNRRRRTFTLVRADRLDARTHRALFRPHSRRTSRRAKLRDPLTRRARRTP